MDIEKMREYLNQINQETFQNKVLNLLLNCFENIDLLGKQITELQEKMNEIIDEVNGNAAALNSEEDFIVEDTGAADVMETNE